MEISRSSAPEWTDTIQHLLRCDSELLNVERVSFWRIDEQSAVLHCEAGYVARGEHFERGAVLPMSAAPEYFAALREARLLDMDDVTADPRCRGLRDYCAARGIASMLDVPVWGGHKLCGVLCHEHVGGMRAWSEREEDFAVGVAQMIGAAIVLRANARAEHAANRAAFLDALSRAAHSSLDAATIADRALALATARLSGFAITWIVDQSGLYVPLACSSADPTRTAEVRDSIERAAAARPQTLPLETMVVRLGQSVLIPELTAATLEKYGVAGPAREILWKLGGRTVMGVRLGCADHPLGALVFFGHDRQFTNDDLALAEDIALRLSAALANARLYAVAQEAIRARDEFLVLASHELRTPLTALQLVTDAVARAARLRGGGDRSRGELIARQVHRFSATVEHMLDAFTVRSEGVHVVAAPCNFASVVERSVQSFEDRARREGSTFEVSVEPFFGDADATRVGQVVDTLLDNALKFGRGRAIAVALRKEGGDAVLTVRDHGIGIPEDRLTGIFQPFERAAPKEHYAGLGLGLYIAKAIVDAHGGSISATSVLGDGATFTVRLPLHENAAAPSVPLSAADA